MHAHRFCSALLMAMAIFADTQLAVAADRGAITAPSTLTPLPQPPARAPKMLAVPKGPPPAGLWVRPDSPIAHRLIWFIVDANPGIAGYRIFSAPQANGQWTLRTPGLISGEPDYPHNPAEKSWVDASLVAPGQMYRVTAVYSDGREGSADFVYTNPLQPQTPTGFTVQQVGPGAVSLSWQPLAFAAFRLFGSGQPATGSLINGTQANFTNLPDGTYNWTLSADYGGVHGPGPSVSITLKTITSGRYRVVANGFRVLNHTNDESNFRSGDGEGDEVYAGFAMFHVARPQGQLLDKDLRSTVVHGDAGRIPNRVKAGSASLQGGLQNNDVVPAVLDPSQRYGQPAGTLTFPFLVWDGTLTNAQDAVIILPSVWESDPAMLASNGFLGGAKNETSFTNWFLAEQNELPKVWADPMVQQALKSGAIVLTTPPGWTYFPATGPLARYDHPVGSIYDQNPIAGMDGLGLGVVGGMGKRLPRRAIILTRETIEAGLSNGSGIVAVPLIDQGAQGIIGNGHYILYVQVERVP